MKFKPDHQFHKFITTGFQFIALNALYLISCLPIITIGIATTALMSTTMSYALGEDDHFLKNYFNSWKENWLKSSGSFLFLAVIILILGFCCFFWLNLNNLIGTALGAFAALVAVYFIIASCFSFALVARFDNSIRRSLRLALTLPLVSLVKSLAILILLIATICCLVLFPLFKFLFMLIGFSFLSYCLSFLILSVFKQLENN